MAFQQQSDISHALSAENEAVIDAAQNASLPGSDEDELKQQQIQQNQTPQHSQEQQKAGTPPSANELNQRRRKLAHWKTKPGTRNQNQYQNQNQQQQQFTSNLSPMQSNIRGYNTYNTYEEPANNYNNNSYSIDEQIAQQLAQQMYQQNSQQTWQDDAKHGDYNKGKQDERNKGTKKQQNYDMSYNYNYQYDWKSEVMNNKDPLNLVNNQFDRLNLNIGNNQNNNIKQENKNVENKDNDDINLGLNQQHYNQQQYNQYQFNQYQIPQQINNTMAQLTKYYKDRLDEAFTAFAKNNINKIKVQIDMIKMQVELAQEMGLDEEYITAIKTKMAIDNVKTTPTTVNIVSGIKYSGSESLRTLVKDVTRTLLTNNQHYTSPLAFNTLISLTNGKAKKILLENENQIAANLPVALALLHVTFRTPVDINETRIQYYNCKQGPHTPIESYISNKYDKLQEYIKAVREHNSYGNNAYEYEIYRSKIYQSFINGIWNEKLKIDVAKADIKYNMNKSIQKLINNILMESQRREQIDSLIGIITSRNNRRSYGRGRPRRQPSQGRGPRTGIMNRGRRGRGARGTSNNRGRGYRNQYNYRNNRNYNQNWRNSYNNRNYYSNRNQYQYNDNNQPSGRNRGRGRARGRS